MKKLEIYLLKELIPVFILGNLFFIFLLLIDKLVNLSELIFTKSVPFFYVVEIIIYYIPSFLVITIPTSVLLASLITYGRLSDDSELIAMKSLGVKKRIIYKPAFLIGIIAFLSSLLMSLYLMPLGNELAIKKLMEIAKFVSLKDFKPKELYEGIPGFILYADKTSNNNYNNLLIIRKNEDVFITAQKGVITNTSEGSLIFDLKNGMLLNMKNKDELPSKIEFRHFLINIPVLSGKKIKVNDERLMNLSSLISKLNKNNIFKFELSKRFALPFASLIMAIFGGFFGSFFHRGGKTFGLFVSIIVVLIYNAIFLFSQNLIHSINPYFAPWIANIIYIACLIPAYKKV